MYDGDLLFLSLVLMYLIIEIRNEASHGLNLNLAHNHKHSLLSFFERGRIKIGHGGIVSFSDYGCCKEQEVTVSAPLIRELSVLT